MEGTGKEGALSREVVFRDRLDRARDGDVQRKAEQNVVGPRHSPLFDISFSTASTSLARLALRAEESSVLQSMDSGWIP